MSFAAWTDKSETRIVEKDLIHGWSRPDRSPSAGRCTSRIALSDYPSPDTKCLRRLCFLRIMAAIAPRRAAPLRAAPDGLSESPLLIWPRDPEMCSGSFSSSPRVWPGYRRIPFNITVIVPLAWICCITVSLKNIFKNTSLIRDAVNFKLDYFINPFHSLSTRKQS